MLALEGIRVLDMSRLFPGPYCTSILADFGAEVIKVEEPKQGDYIRTFPPIVKGFGYWHLQVNRNKKSVTLDLKTETGRKQFLELAKTADVVVESYRPGVMKKLGVDYATVSKLNPKIVYCSLTGYGTKGPLAKQADHDLGYVSLAGITSMSGEKDGKPALPGVMMADINSALSAGMAIMIALHHAQRTGEGQEIDVSLYNTAMSLVPGAAALYFGADFVPQRGNNSFTGESPNYNIYETKDHRYVAVACVEKKFWTNLCQALAREELIDLLEDSHNFAYLKEQLAAEFLKKTMQEWEEYLYGKDTCVASVKNYDEACNSEQTKANEMVLNLQDEELGDYKLLGFHMKLSKTPAAYRKRAPKLGEDNEEILTKLEIEGEEK